jgi:hypothetical protein
MLRRSNPFPQEVTMFSLIALFIQHRRARVATRVAPAIAHAVPRTVANDRDPGLARAA